MAPSKKAGKKSAKNDPNRGRSQNGGVTKADWADSFKKKGAGVSDMTLLSTISNDAINDNLKKRFENSEIYTYIGHVLISVNPFRMLPIYGPDVLNSYKGKNRLEMPPHVYAVAESMYYNMMAYSTNQCVIISGESGAGKTEAAKKIMEYIAAVAGEEHTQAGKGITGVKDMVLATNPLLESFGCAKTLRNNNSSRHGKYLEIEFGPNGEPVGAMITNYLLEKGRIVGQIDDERNFHIFYQFTKGASPQQREEYGIQDPSAYYYTSRAGCLDVPQMDDVEEWHQTLQAIQTIGLSADEQSNILRMLATVLWLGNVQYAENSEGNAYVMDESVVEFVAYLLEVDVNMVKKALTSRTMETQRGMKRGSVYEVPLNKVQAAAARDALAKAVYNNLFEWIVARVNISMKSRTSASYVIGVLDIYGFEIFDHNSFEQLCINYVNERLQQIFIELTLKKEQEEYAAEQITWTPIKFFNNKIVCDLIDEKRPPGIFAAMNDATATAHADSSAADNSFSQRTSMLASNPHFEARGNKFLIKHYAGDVLYDIQGMTDKNKDALGKDLLELVQSSSNSFITGQLFTERIDANSKKRPPSQGDKIKMSANALVEKLMRSQPSYIRTIKPNQSKSPTEYDSPAILHQIKYLGLQENIRIRRAGFAYRNTFEQVVQRFYLLSPATSYAGDYIWNGDSRSGCEKILKDVGIAREEWQMGTTKAFIKNPETLFALEHMRDRYWHNMAARIQRAWRNFLRYRHECATRIQRAWRNNKEGIVYLQLRDAGHQALGGRKERRRFSLLGSRKFLGDYLNVGGFDGKTKKSALGEMLYSKLGLSASERVIFSSKAHILVSKLGRSSKLSPRFLILTDRAVYILITQLVAGTDGQKRSETVVERKINVSVINSVGVSHLRDDWIVLNVSNSEEQDPLLSCVFKTELITRLKQLQSSLTVNIGPTISYRKKKDKMAVIKFQKDETIQRGDVYKSHTVSVPSGLPSTSVSSPFPKKKPGLIRPITTGKLLRKGGPSDNKPRPQARPAPQARPLPGAGAGAPVAPGFKSAGGPPPPPPPPPISSNSSARAPLASAGFKAAGGPPAPPPPPPPPPASSNSSARAPPVKSSGIPAPVKAPPPPPPPVKPPSQPEVALYLAICEFETEESGEIALSKGDLVEVIQEADNGWWLIKKGTEQGWAPSNYLELELRPPVAPSRPNARPPPAPSSQPSAAKSTPAVGLGFKAADSSSAPVAVMPGMGHVNGLAGILAAKRAAAAGQAGEPQSPSSSPNPSPKTSSKGPPPPPPKPKPPTLAPKPTGVGGPPPPVLSSKPNARPGGNPGVGQMDLAAALAKRAGRTG
ncbi:class II myosin [Puccinia graminis f. sp. tritici]|uniref:Class II myosin n=1 Tax=Puccinia graminis f. sp. tritici TaxID=56615 RepID=A0A5B0QPH9_PUCGR|nr:class II myosin [Puccinia graminis f. sp. tritici]